MSSSTTKCKIEAFFTVEVYGFKDEKYLRLYITELIPETLLSLNSLEQLRDEIQEWNILQEEVTGIDLETLDEEKEYQGKFDVELGYESSYSSWIGTDEWDAYLALDCESYKESDWDSCRDLAHERDYSKIFHTRGNNDGDEIYMKLMPSGRIHINYAHCCVRSRGHFVDVATLTRCLAEHLYEYREKKEDESR